MPPSRSVSAAVALDPALRPRRNNLALAYAAAGSMDLARTELRTPATSPQPVSTTSASSTWPQRDYRSAAGGLRRGEPGQTDIQSRAGACPPGARAVHASPAPARSDGRRTVATMVTHADTRRTSFRTRPRRRRSRRAGYARPGAAARAQDAALRGRADRDRAVAAASACRSRSSRRRSICSRRSSSVEIVGGGFVGGASYRYRITDAGRTRAALFLENSHYVGVAPVPLRSTSATCGPIVPRQPRTRRRTRAPGLLAPRHQRPRARPARTGDQCRPFDVRLRPARKRQDGHLAGDPQRCSTATSPSRTRSRSRAASSASSIRSITR